MFILKSFNVEIRVFHVGCKNASKPENRPTMVYTGQRDHSGRIFKCTACGEENSILAVIEEHIK